MIGQFETSDWAVSIQSLGSLKSMIGQVERIYFTAVIYFTGAISRV
jgi:hypothetical protein